MSPVGARKYSNSYLFYFGFLLKSHTFSDTIPPPLTTQHARASAILTQISGNELYVKAEKFYSLYAACPQDIRNIFSPN